jgi:mono/diheme cytochrome c family protein
LCAGVIATGAPQAEDGGEQGPTAASSEAASGAPDSVEIPPGLAEAGIAPEVFARGEAQYRQYCRACHRMELPAGARPDPGSMPAPPAFAVADHYARAFEDPRARMDAIMSFVKRPSEDKALMPGAVRRFGLMPPMPLPDGTLRALAAYLTFADLDKPAWYDEHFREEHGAGEG